MPNLGIVWAVLFYGWFATEIYIAIATRTRKGGGSVSDRGTLPLLWMVIFSSITVSLWVGGAHGPNLPGDRVRYRVAAVLLIALGLVLRWGAVITLGKAFSSNVAIRSTQTVMKTGLYRWARHPSYSAMLLCFLAVGVHTQNWISLLIVTVFPTAALLYRIHVEEIALRGHFGQEYIEYSGRTKRFDSGHLLMLRYSRR